VVSATCPFSLTLLYIRSRGLGWVHLNVVVFAIVRITVEKLGHKIAGEALLSALEPRLWSSGRASEKSVCC